MVTKHHVPKWTLNLNLVDVPHFCHGHIVEAHLQVSPNGSQTQGNWQAQILR